MLARSACLGVAFRVDARLVERNRIVDRYRGALAELPGVVAQHVDAGDRSMLDYNEGVIGQDRPVVESQRPEQLPFDLSAELHIRGVDRASLEYRKWLIELTNKLVP